MVELQNGNGMELGPPQIRVSVSGSVVSDPLEPHLLKFARLL